MRLRTHPFCSDVLELTAKDINKLQRDGEITDDALLIRLVPEFNAAELAFCKAIHVLTSSGLGVEQYLTKEGQALYLAWKEQQAQMRKDD